MAINPSLKFFDSASDVLEKTWKSWKVRHRFTSASWDFLLTHSKAEYFKRRLRNDAWLKRAKDLKKQFPEILFMFMKFMKLKYRLSELGGGVEIRGVDVSARAFVMTSTSRYHHREVNLVVLDVREIPRAKEGSNTISSFLEFLKQRLEPSMTEPNIWLFILKGKDDIKHATAFVATHLEQYEYTLSKYVPSRAELLNGISTQATAPDVPLLFLFKKENAFTDSTRPLLRGKYSTPLRTRTTRIGVRTRSQSGESSHPSFEWSSILISFRRSRSQRRTSSGSTRELNLCSRQRLGSFSSTSSGYHRVKDILYVFWLLYIISFF